MHTPPSPKSFPMAPLAAALTAALSLPAGALPYPVTSTADSGPGTLREAITLANAGCPGDPNPVITFPGSGPFFINLTSALPQFVCSAIGQPINPAIDGSSRTGYTGNSSTTGWNGNALIQLDGFSTFGACGLDGQLYGGTMTVIGIRMTNWAYGGTAICGDTNGSGLVVRNSLISGNNTGIRLAATNTIGGALADRNLIIGNSTAGIGGNPTTASIQNNLIGIDATGSGSAPNGKGIMLSSPSGAKSISNNYIGHNSTGGLDLMGSGWTIQGNRIGQDANGNPASNFGNGITISAGAGPGGTISGNNIIANNSGAGVAVSAGAGVTISSNAIFLNGFGIQLGTGGAPNDTDDLDLGPNGLQNWPQITGVNQSGGNTTIAYSFISAAGTFNLQFFDNDSAGVTQGKTFIGSKSVTVPAGTSTGTHVVTGLYDFVSATATASNGDTSEFAPSVAFVPAPAVTVSPTSVAFGDVPQGGSSQPAAVNFTSSGAGTWNPNTIFLNSSPSCYGGPAYGGFMFSTDCNTSSGAYAPGTGCSATVHFAPINLGPQTAYLCVFDNTTPNGRQSIPLSGNGVVPPTLVLQPSTYDFGGVSVRTTSAPGRFILRNPGTIPVDFTTRVGGPFQLGATTCRSPIDPGSSCALTATFTPTAQGQFSDQLAVIPSVGTPAYSQLFGSGVVGPALQLPNSMEFLYAIGNEPTLRELRVVNTGTAPLTIDSIRITGTGFTLVNPCPSTLAPDEGCILMLGFSSTTAGQTEGALTVNTNAAGGQQIVQLIGLSQTRPIPLISVTPREMSYGTRSFGTTSPTQTITVRNIGGAVAIVNSIAASPDYVITRNTCTTSLAPLATCEADVAMLPTGYGQRRGVVTVNSNDERSPHLVDLLGTSCRTSGLVLGRLGIASGCAP
jgi:hypothetical protein